MRNVIEMYTRTLLFDENTDSVHLEKYATYLREIKERYHQHVVVKETTEAKLNQLKLF